MASIKNMIPSKRSVYKLLTKAEMNIVKSAARQKPDKITQVEAAERNLDFPVRFHSK